MGRPRERERPRKWAITAPSDSRVTVTSVRPLRPYRVCSTASASSTSPSRPGATNSTSAPAATVTVPAGKCLSSPAAAPAGSNPLLGALSVSDVALYRKTYAPLLLTPILAPSPDAYEAEPGESAEAYAARRLGDLRALLERHAHETCAVIVEPLVQCAGGMRMYHPSYLSGLRALCDEFGVHFIADEIAVGFGRTGTLFACEQAGVSPDFMCLSKGLTGGFLPLSAVLTTEPVYEAFYAEYNAGKAFLHSHSYTGNPLACRAALATLDIFRDEPVLERNRVLAAQLARRLAPLREHAHVADVRQTGMIAAVELVRDKATRAPYPPEERRGLRVYLHGLEYGALLRPLGNVVYFMPPYVVSTDELDHLIDVAIAGIERAIAQP